MNTGRWSTNGCKSPNRDVALKVSLFKALVMIKHDVTDEFGYWFKGSLVKNIWGKQVDINKENIDELIERYKRDIQPHKPMIAEINQEIVDGLTELKVKLTW